MCLIRYSLLVFLLVCLAVAGCDRVAEETDDKAEGRESRSAVVAGDLRLAAEAQRAIGLRVQAPERNRPRRVLVVTGWLLAKPGQQNSTRAAATGFYQPPDKAALSKIGSRQTSGQPLGSIRLSFTPQERAQLVIAKEEADILIQQSRVSMEIAATQLESLRESAASGAVAKTRIRELEEIVERARVAQREAQQKLPFLPTEPYDESLGLPPQPITATADGRVVDVHVKPGQLVVQGDPLWTVADWSTLWLRVPVFTGDVSEIARDVPCHVTAGSVEVSGTPIDPPVASEPGRKTVDLFFEVANTTGALRPGQPVEVRVERRESRVQRQEVARAEEQEERNAEEVLVVPRSAVLWDGFGGAWVYVATSAESFRRQRVEAGDAIEAGVVIERGLNDEDRIVTQGSAVLYAEEFKGQIQLDDDD